MMEPDRLESILEDIDIPERAGEKADARYKDLGEFFDSDGALTRSYSPHIYPQGSFRLGTVVRPLDADAEYDLDIGCRLRTGVMKTTHTQRQLKDLVRRDLETYRKSRGIAQVLNEKRRCWRLSYRDELGFHMDVVPSIPEDKQSRRVLRERVLANIGDESFASNVAHHAGAITDNTTVNYDQISNQWKISNSEGYALWFLLRINRGRYLSEQTALAKTKVDDIPDWKRKSPLQEAIKLLKRHRDHMFRNNPDSAPISIIITTLAAVAYSGESSTTDAVKNIVHGMANLIDSDKPVVPNPVNPVENFADKWTESKYAAHDLKGNFFRWVIQAGQDFHALRLAETTTNVRAAARSLALDLTEARAASILGRSPASPVAPAIITTGTRPWYRD